MKQTKTKEILIEIEIIRAAKKQPPQKPSSKQKQRAAFETTGNSAAKTGGFAGWFFGKFLWKI